MSFIAFQFAFRRWTLTVLRANCIKCLQMTTKQIKFVRYNCTACMRFDGSNYFDYTQHLRFNHIEPNYNLWCKSCSLYFKFLHEFVQHMFKKHCYISYDCVCDAQFTCMWELDDHIKVCKNLDREMCKKYQRSHCFCFI